MVRKLFITPESEPSTTFQRCIEIPASQDWLGVFNAALLTATKSYNYEQISETSLTPEEAAARAFQVYIDYLEGACVDCDKLTPCIPGLAEELGLYGLAYNQLPADNADVMRARFPVADRQTSIKAPPAGCDNDILWAGCLEIAERIDQYGLDWLEVLVAETDAIERVASVVALIPLFGDILGESLLIFAAEVTNLRNGYVAHSSTDVIEGIACDLFALGCASCRYPTWDELLDYYGGLGVTEMLGWRDLTIQAIFDYFVGTSGLANQVIYFTTNTLQLFTRYLNGRWGTGPGRSILPTWASYGEDFPSDNWETLCDGCDEVWEQVFDMRTGIHGWEDYYAGSYPFTWVEGKGMLGAGSGTERNLKMWSPPIVATYSITRVRYEMYSEGSGSATENSGSDMEQVFQQGIQAFPGWNDFDGDWTIDDNEDCSVGCWYNTYGKLTYIRTIILNGDGPNPFD